MGYKNIKTDGVGYLDARLRAFGHLTEWVDRHMAIAPSIGPDNLVVTLLLLGIQSLALGEKREEIETEA